MMDMGRPAAAAAAAHAQVTAAPVVHTAAPAGLAAAMLKMAQATQELAAVALAAPPPKSTSQLATGTTGQPGDTTTIKIHYDIDEAQGSLVEAGTRNPLLVIKPGVNATIQYETQAIADAAAQKTMLFTLVRAEHVGKFSHETNLEFRYPSVRDVADPQPVLAHKVTSAALRKNAGTFSHCITEKPLDADRLKFIQMNGKYHGANLASTYKAFEGMKVVYVEPGTPIARALPFARIEGDTPAGKAVTFEQGGPKAALTVSLEQFPAVEAFVAGFLDANLQFISPGDFAVEVRPLSTTDSKGLARPSYFAGPIADRAEMINAGGEITLTCVFCTAAKKE